MEKKYLEDLKTTGNWNYTALAKKTGLSETTIRKVFTDPDNNPTIDTLAKLVVAMGGSIDRLVGIKGPDDAQEGLESKAIQETLKEIRDLRNEMLSHQRESYEREMTNLRTANDHLVAEKKSMRKTLYIVLSVMIALMFATILFLIYDLTHLDRGWIQFFYGAKSSQYDIGSILQGIIDNFLEVFT